MWAERALAYDHHQLRKFEDQVRDEQFLKKCYEENSSLLKGHTFEQFKAACIEVAKASRSRILSSRENRARK
jgi:hypothetical protein